MKISIHGLGAPLVLVPGIQGRWEYMRPAIDALSQSFRVITFPLCGERVSGRMFDPARGLDNFVDQIDEVLDECGISTAPICGVSFGGLVALRYAARRPERSSALILTSAPGPHFHLRKRHQVYLKAPRLFGPVFLAEIPRRVRREVARALPDRRARRRFKLRQVRTFLRAPMSLARMAERARLLGAAGLIDDCAHVSCPTLVITGEPALDFVVPVEGTSDYVRLIAGARAERISRTGHLGYITRPAVFAEAVSRFLNHRADAAA
jgi:pimeloyl-ACP methyl ester carboxylesterase